MRSLLISLWLLVTPCLGQFVPPVFAPQQTNQPSSQGGFTGYPVFGVPPKTSTTAQTSTDNKPSPSETYSFHEELDENYDLFWKFNDTHIVFETRVKTTGYVGFGISSNGAMKNADIVIGWVKDGQTHFSDRHGEGHFLPAVDKSQDWQLLSGTETGGYTLLKMVRKLDTCDTQDRPILDGTTRVIFAYSSSDPTSDNNISYHGNTRGTKSLLLLDPPTVEKVTKPLPDDVKTLEFLNGNYSVPGVDTTYRCTMWKMPDLQQKHHMIRFEPVIQKGHENLLHHIILYYCSGPVDNKYVGTEFDCYRHTPHDLQHCEHVFVAWAIGGQAFNYPDHVGQSLGTPQDPGYFKMETHYDNPNMRSDFVDNSGIRLYLTTQLRQHDAGILETGVHVDAYQIIPPYYDNFLSSGYCHDGCLNEALENQEIHVFGILLHAHLIGQKMRTRHIRNGEELPPIGEDNNYDFNYQEQRLLKNERIIKKGDSIITECEYDSSQRTDITHGGLSSREEMCLSFIIYYPRIPLSKCLSRTNYKIPDEFAGREVFDIVYHLDWTEPAVRAGFVQDIEESDIFNACIGDKEDYKFSFRVTSVPNVTKPYHHQKTCPN